MYVQLCMYVYNNNNNNNNNNDNNDNCRFYLVYWPVISKSSAVIKKTVFVLFVHLI